MVVWNVHGEFNLSCRNKLEADQLAISDVEDKSLSLINNESKLRRNLEEKDNLLASKDKELDDLRVQFDQQKKTIEDLSTQLNDIDRIKEEALRKLAAAEKKTETRDADGGCDEPILRISENKEPQIDNEQVQTAPTSVIPVEMAIPETINSSPVKPSVLVVRSDIMHKSTENSIIVRGIPTWQIGLVIGRNRSNISRIEKGYGVKLIFVKGSLHITEGDEKRRQAACKDVVESLPVVVECPLLPLENQNRISNLLLKEMCLNYNVKICRPSALNKIGVISGRIDRCRTVYNLLKKCV